MTNPLRALAAAALALAALAAPAHAGPIADLYNTGVDHAGVTLAHGAIDPHYRVILSPDGSLIPFNPLGQGPAAVVDPPAGSFPLPPWYPNDPAGTPGGSMWISGPNVPIETEPNGLFVYHTSFTVGAGINLADLVISGLLTADDQVSVILNGNIFSPAVAFTPDEGYGSLYSFAIDSGFRSGHNVLDFVVRNTHGSVQGLRVEMTSAVPEPASLAMCGMAGLAGLGAWARRKSIVA